MIGPGTHLRIILAEIGLHARPEHCCYCDGLADKMDAWGPGKCRQKMHLIVTHLRCNQQNFGWTERLVALGKSAATGLAFRIGPANWLDPFPAIVELACKMAEE